MPAIELLNTIKTSAAKVYEALTTEEGLTETWTTDLEIKSGVGEINEFRFGKDVDRMKTTLLDPGKKIKWLCVQSDPEWIGTVISFELSEKNNVTTIILKQEGWKEVNDFFRSCTYHWGWFLYSLKCYCEEGKGFPYQRRKF